MNIIMYPYLRQTGQYPMSGGGSGGNNDGGKDGAASGGSGVSGDDPIDFHGAAIIGEDGEEIPITEDMIKEACKKLDPTAVGAEAEDADD